MPRLTAVDALKRLLGHLGIRVGKGRTVESALLSETLHYSPTGAEALPRCIASQISKDGGRLFPESAVDSLKVKNGKIESVRIRNSGNGLCKTLSCSHVISTIPITGLLKALRPRVPQGITESCEHLQWLPIVVYGLLVKKERVMNALYTYYRDRVFHRVGEPRNAGLKVEPHGHTVLIVEMTCKEGDEKWQGTQAMKDSVIADLEAEGLCGRADVIEINILRNSHGYPVFSLGYEPHYEKVTGYLEGIDNLQSVGRQGGFSFPNMHSAMRMGADAAEKILRPKGGDNE